MKFLQALIIGICGAAIAVAVMRLANFDGSTQLKLASQPAYDRVMQTRTLRCAYTSMQPYFVTLDADKRMRRGLAKDIVEQMGRILDLQIEWTEEVSPATVADNLESGREDAMCFPLWPMGKQSARLDYTIPIDYMPIYSYVRFDDTRFDKNLSALDDKAMTIPTIEDGASRSIADEDYPRATQFALVSEPDGPHLLLAVTQKRADIAFSDPFTGGKFMKENPGTLKYGLNGGTIRVFPESFAVAKGETKLRDMMNVALDQLHQSGFIRATLDKYLPDHKGEYFYVMRGWNP